MTLALTVGTEHYLGLSALLFVLGAVGLLIRRNPLVMFMCVELMLNAVNISFVAFGNEMGDLGGQLSVLFVLVVAAAEVVVGLAIVVAIMRRRPGATADDISVLRG
jgi:NADH-quinone oxidoreductase subunit K